MQDAASEGRRPRILLPWQASGPIHALMLDTMAAVGLRPDLDCADLPVGGRAGRWAFLLAAVPRARRARRFLLGNYFNRDGRFLAGRATGEIVLLDDGMSTPNAAALRRNPRPRTGAGPLARLRRKLSAPPEEAFRDPERLTFFTFFEDLQVGPRDGRIVHRFPALRARVARADRLDESWFVGTPHVEIFGYPLDRYLEFLRALRDAEPGLVYVPHRHEQAGNLDRYRALGIEVRPLGRSFEVWFLTGSRQPKKVISTTSAVLESLPRIVGDELELVSVRLPLDGLAAEVREPIETGYALLSSVRSGRVRSVSL